MKMDGDESEIQSGRGGGAIMLNYAQLQQYKRQKIMVVEIEISIKKQLTLRRS
jgi:hypothetical protein